MGEREQAVEQIRDGFGAMESLVGRFADLAQERSGLSGPQMAAMRVIGLGAAKVSDVAKATFTHLSTASRVVDQLVEAGYLTRHEDPDDRRAVILGFTQDGMQVVVQLHAMGGGIMGQALAHWPIEDVQSLGRLIVAFQSAVVTALDAQG
ncbi:MAG: DNA-binding MarR family transcriptional regulator [Glaciecola sp.]|jgi:DNA-binding MarR family transcriptional regulator